MEEKIEIDARTKETLLNIRRSQEELRIRLELIIQTILNMKNIDGQFEVGISPDCSFITLMEKKNADKTI